MSNLIVFGKTEEKARKAAEWIVSGDVVGDKYTHQYELSGKSIIISAQPFWIGCPIPHPVVDSVLIYCDQESDLLDMDEIVHFYLSVPVKFIIYEGVGEQKAFESKWTARGIQKKVPGEIVEKLINAHNDLVKLVSKVFNAFDKDHNQFIDISEIKLVAKELGVELPESELKLLVAELDFNKDGKISLLEFTEWWRSGRKGKTMPLSEVIMRQIKKSASLSMAADLLTQYGGIEELKGEEQKLVTSTLNIHVNKVTSPGILFNWSFFSKGKPADSIFQTYADAISIPSSEVFVGLSFRCKNPKAAQEKLKEIVDAGLAMAVGLAPQASMIQSVTEIKYGVAGGKAVIAILPIGGMKEAMNQSLVKIKAIPSLSIQDQIVDIYASLATDFQKLFTEDKPFYELLLQGISIETKAQALEKSADLIVKAAAAQEDMTLQLIPPAIRPILKMLMPYFRAMKRMKGDIEFKVDKDLIDMISEKLEGTPLKTPLKDLKASVIPMIKPIIEGMPIAAELHKLFSEEISSIEFYLHFGGYGGFKFYCDLPGLNELLKLDQKT